MAQVPRKSCKNISHVQPLYLANLIFYDYYRSYYYYTSYLMFDKKK